MHVGNFHLRLLAFLIPLPVNYKPFGLNHINNEVLKCHACSKMFEIFNRSFTCNQFSKKFFFFKCTSSFGQFSQLDQTIAFNIKY